MIWLYTIQICYHCFRIRKHFRVNPYYEKQYNLKIQSLYASILGSGQQTKASENSAGSGVYKWHSLHDHILLLWTVASNKLNQHSSSQQHRPADSCPHVLLHRICPNPAAPSDDDRVCRSYIYRFIQSQQAKNVCYLPISSLIIS